MAVPAADAGPREGGEYVIGVDVGGTFTDGLLLDPSTSEMRWSKVPTTPEDQAEGTLEAVAQTAVELDSLGLFCHGTTVGINALLQRRGTKVGLICTEGMRDLLDVGQFTRAPDRLYDPTWIRPHQERPIVERRLIREIGARVLYDGSRHVELDLAQVRREVEFLRDEGVEAVGVSLMHAYLDLGDEEAVIGVLEELMPGCYVQSSAVRPVVGEYARMTATVLDAYTGPVVSGYLRRLDRRLRSSGYDGPAVIMQMNGGVRTLESTAASFPAYTMLSGPVAGLLGAEYYAREFLDRPNLVCIDIGGTSTDLGLVVDGKAQTVLDWEAEWRIPLGMPAVDVRSIGAGGGSLIQADEMGTLGVGPESAGADPGPASYGRGGTQPTITDAHVVLGEIRPAGFLGGQMSLDVEAARAAIGGLAELLEMEPVRLAAGAIQLMNINIETEISKMLFESGADVREFALLSYGGAGSLHAVEVARSAGIPEVIVPRVAGGFSALGLATAPARIDRAVSRVMALEETDCGSLQELFEGLAAEALAELEAQGVASETVTVSRSISAMYTGQGISNELDLPDGALTDSLLAEWARRFDQQMDRLYGYSAPEMGLTITTLSVTAATAPVPFKLARLAEGGAEPPAQARGGEGEVFLGGQPARASFFSRAALLAGNVIHGPAVLEEDMTTTLVPAGASARVDAYGNLRIRFA